MPTPPEAAPPAPLVVIAPPTDTPAPQRLSEPPAREVPWRPVRSIPELTTSGPDELMPSERPLVHWLLPVPGPEPATKHVERVALGPR